MSGVMFGAAGRSAHKFMTAGKRKSVGHIGSGAGGAVPQAKRFRATSAWNIFVQERQEEDSQNGAAPENVDLGMNVCKDTNKIKRFKAQWAEIKADPVRLAVYEAKAAQITNDRKDASQQPLFEVVDGGLSNRQKQRIGDKRLAASVRSGHSHPVWQSGLQLWDLTSPLRASLVDTSLRTRSLDTVAIECFATNAR